MRPFFILSILILAPFTLLSQNEGISEQHARILRNNQDGETLKDISFSMLNKGDYDKAISYAKQLEVLGDISDNDDYRMYGAISLGQALMMNGETDQAKHYMDRALELALKLQNDSALCSVYNGLGLYASNVELNYYKSISYFFEGLEAAKRSSYQRLYSILLANLSGVYFLKNDPAGLKYALECHELGHSLDDPYMIFTGSASAAYLYYLLKDYDKALQYIQEAEFVMEKNDYYDQAHIYNLHGNILHALEDKNSAISFFEKALEFEESSQTTSVVYTYLSYAKVLMEQKEYTKAIELLKKGIEISKSGKNPIHRSSLYEALSLAYEIQGSYKDALEYYKIFRLEADSLFNMDKERSLSELRIQYDLEKHENELQESKIELMKKEKNMQLMLFCTILFLLTLALLYYLYHKKHKLYMQIVKQSQEALKREKQLENKIEQLSNDKLEEKYVVSSLSDERGQQLFKELDELMRNQHIYREKNLTKDKLSKMLNTNRTYLSQVINENTGLSFTHYLNSLRINEAINILSDIENSLPIKALASDLGFNSINTFYKAFQSSVGVTPSLYREKVLELKKRNMLQ